MVMNVAPMMSGPPPKPAPRISPIDKLLFTGVRTFLESRPIGNFALVVAERRFQGMMNTVFFPLIALVGYRRCECDLRADFPHST